MMKHFLLPWLPAVLLCAACSPESSIDRLCRRLFPEGEPGAAVLVLKGDHVLFDKGYGLADLQTRAPIDGNTSFNIASVSKQFTAVAVLQLAGQGAIDLDDSIAEYFPELQKDFWKEVRIKHLLSHSSGVPDARDYLSREQKILGDEDLALEYLPHLDSLRFAPGTAYEYMNPTYVLLGRLVERVSGEPFEAYVRTHIFAPAGMERTVYFDRDHQERIPAMAHGYGRDDADAAWQEYDFGEETFFATRPDGGIYTSTHEFVLWEKALRNGTVLEPERLAEAMHPHTLVSGSPWSDYQNRPGTWYGYGWFVEPATADTPLRIYHTGDNGGFKILAARIPDKELLILVFANRSDWDRYDLLLQIEKAVR